MLTKSQEITALTRESSLQKPVVVDFKNRGVNIVTTDLRGPKKDLVDLLRGIDVVISCIFFLNLKDQIPLIEAAKEAGVKRFVPSSFGTPAPRGGVMRLADQVRRPQVLLFYMLILALERGHCRSTSSSTPALDSRGRWLVAAGYCARITIRTH